MYEQGRRELWGYVVWGLVAVVILVPEVSAAFHKVPWPTISGTVGHLEYRWSWVALIVVGLIVFPAYYVLRFPTSKRAPSDAPVTRMLRRSRGDRITFRQQDQELSALVWLPIGAVAVAAGAGVTAAVKPHNPFLLAYVLYGLIGVFGILVPSLLALALGADAPFPPLVRAIGYLEARWHPLAAVVAIGLVILLIHLALYPWPGIFQVLQQAPTVRSP